MSSLLIVVVVVALALVTTFGSLYRLLPPIVRQTQPLGPARARAHCRQRPTHNHSLGPIQAAKRV